MKRSEINRIIEEALSFFGELNFSLPEWGYWNPEDWKKQDISKCHEIFDHQLGWDITDFGGNDFKKRGLVLFTIRNGSSQANDKPYCEKIMIAGEDQETPLHFHYNKMEDIINRGGGNLIMELFPSTQEGKLTKGQVEVSIDGILKNYDSGERFILKPGQSICLTSGLYHRFYGEKGKGRVLVGEVSTVNDDANDNRFYDEVGRFPEIDEDVTPGYYLVSDYQELK
jgi:hypothetical protein